MHWSALHRIPELKISCFIDSDRKKAESFSRKVGAVSFDRVEDLPAGVESALIAVSNDLRGPLTQQLLQKGLHVLCEAPMALSFDECNQMIKASQDFGKSLMINHSFRFHPPIRELKRLIAEGVLGEIQRVDMALGYKTTGGGVLMDLGCHLIDLTLWIFGPIQHVEAVSAYEKDSGGNRDVLHSVKVILKTGLSLSIRLSGSDRLQSYSADRLENEITVTGSLATCKASFDNPTLVLYQSNTVALCKNKGARFTLKGIDRFEGSWRFFVTACDQKTSLRAMLQHAAETIYWIEKIYQITRRHSI